MSPPPIANAPTKTVVAMNDSILMIKDDDTPPTTMFGLTKQAKPHSESTPDSNETPATTTATIARMNALMKPQLGSSLDVVPTIMPSAMLKQQNLQSSARLIWM